MPKTRWLLLTILAIVLLGVFVFGARLVHIPLGGFFNLQNSVKTWTRAVFQAQNLSQELQNFKSQINALTSENARLQELEQENLTLRQTLQFVEKEKYPIVVARVITRLTENGTPFLLINRGKEQGIMLDAPVLADGVLIGKVIKTQQNSSMVIPLIGSGVKTAAAFTGNAKTSGVVEGELNVSLMMRLIPKDVTVVQGLSVITSGLELRIPRGLLIGTVAAVAANPQELFQTATLQLPVALDEISLVSVITQSAP